MDVKKILKTFKTILNEAAKTFGVPAHEVNNVRFFYVSQGRIPKETIQLFGGYGKLKAYVAPNPKSKDDDAAKAMQSLLKSLNGGK
jgi:hypothetical protein